MTVTKQFKITLKMIPCQFQVAPWRLETRFMAIFVAVVGLTIATTPASAFSFKTDNLIKNSSVNPLPENHPSLNWELDLTKTKPTGNEATDKLNLNQVRPYHLNKQGILAGKYTSGNQVSQLLQKAESNIEEITQASEVSNEIIDGKTFYKYQLGDTNINKNTHTYTNTWKAPASPPKRKIPEPSTILGLIAIASLFVTQRKKMKIG